MRRLLITDALGELVVAIRLDDGYAPVELERMARREAEAQAARRGRLTWVIQDPAGRQLAAGEAAAPAPQAAAE